MREYRPLRMAFVLRPAEKAYLSSLRCFLFYCHTFPCDSLFSDIFTSSLTFSPNDHDRDDV